MRVSFNSQLITTQVMCWLQLCRSQFHLYPDSIGWTYLSLQNSSYSWHRFYSKSW